MPLEFTVTSESDGHRLDQFLVSVLGGHSRSQIQKLIAAGHVTVADRDARANLTMHEGDRVSVEVPPIEPASVTGEPLPLEILYQDRDIAVLNKQAGMVVHPGAGHASGTLVNALLHHMQDLSGIGGEARPGIVHRLDRGTSGVMVIAKNDLAHQELARQFHDREVQKEYVALVWGVVQAGRRIEAAIGRDPVHRQK
ncbi:MAG: RluA family pseudouridine synthase, partial [Vicinamibacterales bacterium]